MLRLGIAVGHQGWLNARFEYACGASGRAGKSWSYGLPWLLNLAFMLLFCALSGWWIAPRLRQATAARAALTLPEWFGRRFADDRVRRLAALIVVFASLLYMTALFKGVGNLLEVFLAVPCGAVIVPLLLAWRFTSGDRVVHEVFPALATSTVLFLVFARVRPPAKDAALPRTADA